MSLAIRFSAAAATSFLLVLAPAANRLSAQEAADGAPSERMQVQEFSKEIVREIRLDYLLYLPPEYEQQDEWPLVLFLHGAGERGDDLGKVQVHGPPKLVAAGQDFPFVLISPQCPEGSWWDVESLAALIEDAKSRLKIDPDRVYCTGLSMGGFGTWALAEERADLFAAIAPICGGGESRGARRYARRLPVWVFHGAKDDVVPLERSQEMVDALHRYGDGAEEVEFTVYPDAGHDSWTATYDNPQLYDWLLSHRRGDD